MPLALLSSAAAPKEAMRYLSGGTGLVRRADGEPDLLYVDLHLVHEVSSPQAFDGLRAAGEVPVARCAWA